MDPGPVLLVILPAWTQHLSPCLGLCSSQLCSRFLFSALLQNNWRLFFRSTFCSQCPNPSSPLPRVVCHGRGTQIRRAGTGVDGVPSGRAARALQSPDLPWRLPINSTLHGWAQTGISEQKQGRTLASSRQEHWGTSKSQDLRRVCVSCRGYKTPSSGFHRHGHAHKDNGAIKSPKSRVSKHLNRLIRVAWESQRMCTRLCCLPVPWLPESTAGKTTWRAGGMCAHRHGLGDGTQEGTRPAKWRGKKGRSVRRSRANTLHQKAVITAASIQGAHPAPQAVPGAWHGLPPFILMWWWRVHTATRTADGQGEVGTGTQPSTLRPPRGLGRGWGGEVPEGVDICARVLCVLSLRARPTLRSYALQPIRLLCPWDSAGKNTGAGCHAVLHLPDLGIEPESPTLQADPLSLSPQGSPIHTNTTL